MSSCNIVNDINSLVNSYGENLIRQLANQYGFDSQDAINKFIYLETNTNLAKPQENEQRKQDVESSSVVSSPSVVSTPSNKVKFVLPWCGNPDSNCCQGLKNNYGLFTQCMNPKHGKTEFCKQCVASIAKNDDEHPCGTVKLRLQSGIFDYKDPKGKKVVHYTQYMKKFNITKQQVLDMANSHGISIDEAHFTPPTTKRGRPSKKTTIVNDSDEEHDPKRPPGRPKKLSTDEPSPEDIISDILSSHKLSQHTPNLHDHLFAHKQRIPTSPSSP